MPQLLSLCAKRVKHTLHTVYPSVYQMLNAKLKYMILDIHREDRRLSVLIEVGFFVKSIPPPQQTSSSSTTFKQEKNTLFNIAPHTDKIIKSGRKVYWPANYT